MHATDESNVVQLVMCRGLDVRQIVRHFSIVSRSQRLRDLGSNNGPCIDWKHNKASRGQRKSRCNIVAFPLGFLTLLWKRTMIVAQECDCITIGTVRNAGDHTMCSLPLR